MIASIVLLAAQLGGSSEPRRLFAAGDKDVMMMLPQETVCGSEVGQMLWTADGSHLAVLRTAVDLTAADVSLMTGASRPTPEALARMHPRTELILWSVASRKARTIATVDPSTVSIQGLSPMPGTDRLAYETISHSTAPDGTPIQTIRTVLLAATTGSVVDLGSATGDTILAVQMADSKPLGAVVRQDPKTLAATVQLFGPAGRPISTFGVPARSGFMFDAMDRPTYVKSETLPGGKRQMRVHILDTNTGREVSVLPWKPPVEKVPAPAPLSLGESVGQAEGASAPTVFLNVAGGKKGESGVVTTDGTRGLLSPKGDAVAYLSQGSAMVRRLARVDRKAYEAARAAAQRTVALSNAKQAALALIMYAADSDDTLPGSGDYGKIEPYLRNSTVMNAFTYTYAGGKMTDIDKPAETEIGYASGPGGRAVAYADGHVRWVPDTP